MGIKKSMIGLLGLHMLALGSISGMTEEPYSRRRHNEESAPPKRKPLTLANYNHVGEIPKGCKVTRETITVFKDNNTLTIEVDILHGTEKGRMKKYIKYEHEIETYIRFTPLQEIIDSGRFFVCDNNVENNTPI